MVKVIKKDGKLEDFDIQKVYKAVGKSAKRVGITLTDDDLYNINKLLVRKLFGLREIDVSLLHEFVEFTLDEVSPKVAQSYREYRNYKVNFAKVLDSVYQKEEQLRHRGDKENSNLDSALVSTKRSISYGHLNKEFYKMFNLDAEERQSIEDGYIYIHDMSARRDTFNCCIFDVATVLKGGFEMGNIWYNEPKTLATAFDVIGDIILSASGQQYGGFTVPEVDKLLRPYAIESYSIYVDELEKLGVRIDIANQKSLEKVQRDFEQGFQGWEYKFNTVASSRGDYPFIAMTFGIGTDYFEKMASESILKVRMNGQGKDGNKKPVLFPKLIFLYDEKLHGDGGCLEQVLEKALDCSAKAMYPDYLSLSGDGYVADMYKKYGLVISPMGCRAFLSPWYEKGGMFPQDEDDKPIFVGRFNYGVVSLNLPMIIMKACTETKDADIFKVLDYYLEMIRGIHKKTKEFLGELKASTNPLAFCEGGLYGGNLNPHDKIAPLLESATASFGITALNECERLLTSSSLVTDGGCAIALMNYIVDKVEQFKKEDGILYAIYGTPAENLCGLQVEQFKKKYGVIEGVSDRAYFSNSFHCHVTEDITPIQKQDLEKRFWDFFNGGKIQYVKYPISYNKDAMRTLVKRGMKFGFYEGVNLALSYCDDCGHEELNMEVCSKCGSANLTKIDRINGYLAYSRVKGDHRMNNAKLQEIKDRVSM